MTIRKRGKFWEAQVRVKGYPAVSRSFDTKSDAADWKAKTMSDMRSSKWHDRRPAQRMPLADALDKYRDEYVPRLKDAKRTASRCDFLKKRIGKYSMATFGQLELARYRDERAASVKSHTVRLDLALISRLFEVARRDWGLDVENPAKHITKPRTPRGRKRRLVDGEEPNLLAAARAGRRPIFANLLEFALATAMRRSELAGMTWDQVDLKRRVVHLAETKNGSARDVPLSSTAVALLQQVKKAQAAAWQKAPAEVKKPDKRGTVWGMTADAITQAMDRSCARAGIEGLTFHDLRHEATSRLFERTDLDSMEIAIITGHKSMQMMRRYAHLRAANLADRLDGVRRGQEQRGT